MKIERLAIKGVLRFGAPVYLDFRDLPPGLVAVVGPNGEGKTSLIESMLAGYYREFPTRGLAIDYATEKDSYIQVISSFDDGRQLDGRVNMDGVQRISDAVLRDASGAFLNDGKVTTFDAAVAKELPPLAQLLASSFSAQNRRGTFSTLDKRGRRDLFASLLGLAQLEAHAATSRQAALMVERRLSELRAVLERLTAETSEALQASMDADGHALANRATGGRAGMASAMALVTDLQRRRDAASVTATVHTRAQTAYGQAFERQHQLKGELREVETKAAEAARRLERLRHDTEATLQRVIDRESAVLGAMPTEASIADTLANALRQIAVNFEAARALRMTRIANNQDLINRAEHIRAARAEADGLQGQIVALETDLAQSTTRRSAGADALNRLTHEQATLSSTHRDLNAAQASADLLKRVPFGDKCVEAGCELVQSAKASRDLIPALESQQQRWRDLAAEIVAAAADLSTIDQRDIALRKSLIEAKQKFSALQPDADLVERLNAAETRVAELTAEIETLRQQHLADQSRAHQESADAITKVSWQIAASATTVQRAKEETDVLMGKIAVEEANSEAGFKVFRDEIDVELVTVTRTMLDTAAEMQRTAPAQVALARIDDELREARERVSQETATAARLEAETEAFERRRRDFAVRLGERIKLTEARQALEQELVEWQALARIFGAEGLPVLEIDAAGPGVSALANDLLHACFGSRFTVELVTQEAKASGKGLKEVFELKVYDGERGGEARDLKDLSGGEQVLVDEALKSAIALFVNQRNVAPIRTCWRDETTGALDPENALRYIAMLRRVHERAGLHHLFFVSHNPEAAALADAQIVIADGTARIVMPPFRSEAA